MKSSNLWHRWKAVPDHLLVGLKICGKLRPIWDLLVLQGARILPLLVDVRSKAKEEGMAELWNKHMHVAPHTWLPIIWKPHFSDGSGAE